MTRAGWCKIWPWYTNTKKSAHHTNRHIHSAIYMEDIREERKWQSDWRSFGCNRHAYFRARADGWSPGVFASWRLLTFQPNLRRSFRYCRRQCCLFLLFPFARHLGSASKINSSSNEMNPCNISILVLASTTSTTNPRARGCKPFFRPASFSTNFNTIHRRILIITVGAPTYWRSYSVNRCLPCCLLYGNMCLSGSTRDFYEHQPLGFVFCAANESTMPQLDPRGCFGVSNPIWYE